MVELRVMVEDELAEAAARLAHERRTTVDRLIGETLRGLVSDQGERHAASERLRQRMQRGILTRGDAKWTRESLHER